MFWMKLVGGRRQGKLWPSSVVVMSPTRRFNCGMNGAQCGGMVFMNVLRFATPTMSTPHADVSGVKVMPTSVA